LNKQSVHLQLSQVCQLMQVAVHAKSHPYAFVLPWGLGGLLPAQSRSRTTVFPLILLRYFLSTAIIEECIRFIHNEITLEVEKYTPCFPWFFFDLRQPFLELTSSRSLQYCVWINLNICLYEPWTYCVTSASFHRGVVELPTLQSLWRRILLECDFSAKILFSFLVISSNAWDVLSLHLHVNH